MSQFGFLIVDKPAGLSSFGLVKIIRGISKEKAVGHCGTLDPLAEGMMILALGPATKFMDDMLGWDKTYEVEMQLGMQTSTDDLEGEVLNTSDQIPSVQIIRDTLMGFQGEIMQTPPAFSAIKINGQRAYDRARKGEKVELEARPVRIHKIYDFAVLGPAIFSFKLDCGSGTYVRSLVRDVGLALGCGAVTSKIRRTRVGQHTIDRAISLEKLRALPLEQWPIVQVHEMLDYFSVAQASSDLWESKLKHGAALRPLEVRQLKWLRHQGDHKVLLLAPSGAPGAILTGNMMAGFRPKKVFHLS